MALIASPERSGSDAPFSASELVARIERAVLETAPFDHVYLDQAFPATWYRTMLDHLPELRRYRELRHREAMRPDGHSARRKFYLFPEHIALLPSAQRRVWRVVSDALRSAAVQDAFKHKFRRALEERFERKVDALSFYAVPMLLRDVSGYRIGIHGDSVGKAITVQFYLPHDDRQAHLGTILHEDRVGAGAERTRALRFRPASAYAFPVVYHRSWHSVAFLSDADGERNSLMLTYLVQDRGRSAVNRLKRAWTFLAYGIRP
jgi:hypothetical protein